MTDSVENIWQKYQEPQPRLSFSTFEILSYWTLSNRPGNTLNCVSCRGCGFRVVGGKHFYWFIEERTSHESFFSLSYVYCMTVCLTKVIIGLRTIYSF